MNRICKIKTIALGALAACWFSAVAEDTPVILTVQPLYDGALNNMSANGLWAVGDAVNPSNSSFLAYPRLVNTLNGETLELFSEDQALMGTPMSASCVSDDGKTVGGSYSGYPAVWKEGKGWKSLPMPAGKYNGGTVYDLTPDGRYAVGCVSIDLFQEHPCLWDLDKMELVELPGMIGFNPRYKDMIEQGGDPAEWTDDELNVRLTGVTPDGNVLLGTVDFAFPDATWEFIYRRDEAKWIPLGLKYENGRLLPLDSGIAGVGECVLSSDGKLIGGVCMTVSESSAQFTCPVDDPEAFTLHQDGDGFGVWAIGCDGVVYGSTPTGTPVRNWSAKVGRYWYDWKQILKQLYGIDWMADVTKDDLGLSGTVEAVSTDNLKILASDYARKFSYIITLPRPINEICGGVDLLGDYRVSPQEGAEFSMLRTIVVDFGRDVQVVGEKTCVSLVDAEGNVLRKSINLATQADNDKRVEVIFRDFPLEPGKAYTVVVPSGSICVAGDSERVNEEIRFSYRGREAGPVKPVSFSPAEGASVPRINFTTNPVIVTFNAAIAPGDNPDIRLYQVKDGVEEFLYALSASVSERQVMIYPVSEQRLAEGSDYRIDFCAGSVTDLSGDGSNEAFSIIYHGSYVPEINASSNTIFSEDFSTGLTGMMIYDGDGNVPTDEMKSLDFEVEGVVYPWIPTRDEDDVNFAAASHSCYDPAGKSDDWMVTPQLYIPDDKATLTFKSQSYRADKKDVLKVYVWPSEDVVTILTQSIVDKMRYDGDLVYSEVQTPGASEDNLKGDWTLNSVDLSKYAGKYVYIAFVNDNQNQSVVFVDDVVVSREMAAVLSIDTPEMLVNEDEVKIRGRFVVMKEAGIEGYEIVLADSEGKILASVSSDEVLEGGEMGSFVFDTPVPLEKGEVNSFAISFTSGSETVKLDYDIRNLLFATTKRVVLEEMTGTGCQFCPEGILGIEMLKDLYGDIFIPMAIHSYQGDKMGGPEHNAYSAFLGHAGAPTGNINRGPVTSPMYQDLNNGGLGFTSPDGMTWLQKTEEALMEMAQADFEIVGAWIDEQAGKVSVDACVKAAVSLRDASINVFGVLMEDGIMGLQTNGLFNTDDPALGEWGSGGKYAQSNVLWSYDDVVRGTSAFATAGIYSGFNGLGGYIPSEVKAGEEISFTFDFALPSGIADLSKTKVCLMMIDANSGKYINAALSGHIAAAVDGIAIDGIEVADVYDLAGRLVMRAASVEDLDALEKGVYIRAGKKFIKH
ncbi:MAG: choice-of-anchor J domain-containing protein [Muribaculaceae bacterium]|nr:choice-of-anchor J domain-containing protein [Muribaculaceae bacterium]